MRLTVGQDYILSSSTSYTCFCQVLVQGFNELDIRFEQKVLALEVAEKNVSEAQEQLAALTTAYKGLEQKALEQEAAAKSADESQQQLVSLTSAYKELEAAFADLKKANSAAEADACLARARADAAELNAKGRQTELEHELGDMKPAT